MNYRSHSLRSRLLVSLRPRRSSLSRFALLLAAIGLVSGARAQTAHFVGYETQITTGFTQYYNPSYGGDAPAGLAVDPSGNLFVADPSNSQVLKFTPSGSGYLAPTVLASGFEPNYIAAGNDGTIYCAGGNGDLFAFIPKGNGYSVNTVRTAAATSPYAVSGVAVDSSGNVYLADVSDSEVIKYVAVGAQGTSRTYTSLVVGSGLQNLAGVAVSGTAVFVTNGTQLLRYLPINPGYVNSTYNSPTVIAQGFSALSDVAVTSAGTILAADNGPIYKVTQVGSVYSKSYFANPGALNVAADSSGNVYVSVSNDVNVLKIAPNFPSFGQLQANGTTSATQTAGFIFDSPGTARTLLTTQGLSNQDFKVIGPVTGTYTAGQELDLPITFQPLAVGGRSGAAQITTTSGSVLSTLYLRGIGTGPLAALYPGLQSTLLSGTTFHPQAMAVDPAGNVYICDPINNSVVKETVQYGTYVKSFVGSSLSSPSGIALDGAGNLYISDTGNGRVLKETYLGGTSYSQSVVDTATTPLGLAVDGNGVLYVSDGSSGVSTETPLGAAYIKTALSTGASAPNGVAVDSSGNLYISDLGNKRILFEAVNYNGTAYQESTVVSGFTPSGVSVDGSGNIYIPDYDTGRIVSAMPGYGQYTPFTVATGLSTPGGIAVDQTGNLYIGDSGNQRVLKVDVSGGGLIYPDTAIGANSTPRTVTFSNIGNYNLVVGIPASGYNPSLSPSFTLDSSTTCSQIYPNFPYAYTVLPNTNCTYAVDFSPTTAGVAYGSLILSDNSENTANSQQSVFLGGNGVAPTKTITFQQPTSPTMVGNSATLSATASNGDPVTFAVTSGTAIISGTTVVYNTAGYVTITANSAASGNYAAATPVSVNVQVVAPQQTVSWQPSTLSIYTGTPLGTGVLDATSNVAANITYIATQLMPPTNTNTVTASTVLSMGHYLLTATVTPTVAGYTTFSSSLPFYVQNMNPFIANTNGSMSSLYNNGTAQSSSATGGGIGAAVDSSGYVWSLSSNGSSAVKYTDTGAVSATYSNVGLVAATSLAVDGLGQVWIANSDNTVTVLSNAGAVVSTATNVNLSGPSGVAIDMSGNVWITSSANNTVEEVIGGAGPVAPLTNAVQNLSPATRP